MTRLLPLVLLYACTTTDPDGDPTDAVDTTDTVITDTTDTVPGEDTVPADTDDTVPDDTDDTVPDDTDTVDTEDTDPVDTDAAPTTFDDVFLWQPLDFTGATDLGHMPSPITNPAPAGTVVMTDVAQAAGLGLSQGNTHGTGVGFFDVNGDGWDDILVVSGNTNSGTGGMDSSLYINNTDGTFTEMADHVDALDGIDAYSVAAADYDGDGDFDVYVSAHPTSILLQNDGNGVFTDVTAAAGAAGPTSRQRSNTGKIAVFGDYDNDGWMDIATGTSLFVGGNAANGYLLHNNGDGTFTDVTTSTGFLTANQGNTCAMMFTDYDNDGDSDIFSWNDIGGTTNRSLLDNDGGLFTDVFRTVALDNRVTNPMGIDSADIDRNGWLDYYVTNISTQQLYLFNGTAFLEAGSAAGVRGGNFNRDYGWGLGFEDLNGDTWWDIFVANEDNAPHTAYVHNGPFPGRVPTFTRINFSQSINSAGGSHAVPLAFADYDHNGTVDAVAAHTDGSRLQLWRNDTDLGDNGWLHVRIPDDGTGQNGGISARVVIKVGDTVLWRDMHGGKSRAAQSAHEIRFGLGAWDGVEWVAALWPDGRQSALLNVAGNQTIELPAPTVP